MTPAELVTATPAQLDELLRLAKPSFPAAQYALLEGVLSTFVSLMQALQNAKSSIKRLRQMLFGAPTEHKRNVLGPELDATASTSAAASPSAPAAAPPEVHAPGARPRRGHGRNGVSAYRDAPIVELHYPELHAGDPCPQCATGKVYESAPRSLVRVIGQAPLAGTIYKLQCLRCRLCDARFSAPLPAGVGASKYDPSCASMIALLRYGNGMPFYRLEGLQADLGVPLPDATQWELVTRALPGPRCAFEELIRQAAQAPLLHHDDTPARILALMAERKTLEAAGGTPSAKAINTSGIVAQVQAHRVVLFFTGHAHAGENLAQVLAHRAAQLPPPMQMCDALACNSAGKLDTILCHCLAHGRRKLVDIVEHFPAACRTVIEVLAKVYANDAHCRDGALSPEDRLAYHRAHSEAPMHELKGWMNEQFEQRLVEPNSGLGQALRYFLKHWSALTLFLRKAGAPLDNNVCEQALKRAILHRKNSMFYKTSLGAELGDIYMSLIHTCRLCNVNAFAYLQALQVHAQAVKRAPYAWLPWNYHEQRMLDSG